MRLLTLGPGERFEVEILPEQRRKIEHCAARRGAVILGESVSEDGRPVLLLGKEEVGHGYGDSRRHDDGDARDTGGNPGPSRDS